MPVDMPRPSFMAWGGIVTISRPASQTVRNSQYLATRLGCLLLALVFTVGCEKGGAESTPESTLESSVRRAITADARYQSRVRTYGGLRQVQCMNQNEATVGCRVTYGEGRSENWAIFVVAESVRAYPCDPRNSTSYSELDRPCRAAESEQW